VKESRITRNTYILLGVTVLLLIGAISAWYFGLIRPQKALLATATTNYNTQLGIANQLPTALTEQKKAEDRLVYLQGQMGFLKQRYRNLYFGDLGVDYASETPLQKANREIAWRNWMNTYYYGYGPALKRELERAADAAGVVISTSISVVPPPKAPEEVAPPANGLLKPVGSGGAGGAPGGPPIGGPPGAAGAGAAGGAMSVTVSGSLDNILRYFDSLNTYATLVNVGNITLNNDPSSPTRVSASFSITPYLLASGPGSLKVYGGIAGAGAPAATGLPGTPMTGPASATTTASAPVTTNSG
jgi:hypothetical protein